MNGCLWSWPDVKSELEKRGLSLTSIALRAKVTPQAVAKVKKRPSARIQALIASALGVAPQSIWPSRYHEKQRRRRRA